MEREAKIERFVDAAVDVREVDFDVVDGRRESHFERGYNGGAKWYHRRGMRRSLASTLAIACLATTTLVLGQGRKTIRPKPRPKQPAAAPVESRPAPVEDKPKDDEPPASPDSTVGAPNSGEPGSEAPPSAAARP